MGLAAVAAVGAGAGGLTQPSRAATQRGIEFGRTIDMVEDAGCDHTGGQPIDAALDEHAGDDTLLEFPPGTYLVEREHEFEGLSNFGIVGLGDSRDEVEFVFPSGYSGIFLALWRGSDWLIENVTVQQSSDHQTGVGVVFVPYDNLQVHEFEVAGYSPWRSEGGQRAMYLDVLDPDGTAIVDGYYRTGPAHMADTDDNYSEGCQALLTDDYHEGTLYLRNCRIENASENAFYCSRGPGDVRIENCHFENNDNAAVRISTDGSYIRDSTIVVDTENAHPDNEGEFHNPRGLWVEDMSEGSSGAVAENCEFVLQSAPKIAGLLHVDASQGRFEASNCRFYNGDAKDWNHLFVWLAEPNGVAPDQADVRLSGCSFVAEGAGSRPSIDLRGRSNSAIVNCCLSGTGDGILLSDATDCVIEDTTIDVEGTAIEYDNASAATTNVTYDGSCPLPEPLASGDSSETSDGSTSDGTTSDGSTSDGTTSDGSISDGTTSDGSTDTTSTLAVESDGGGVADYAFGVDGELAKGPEADGSDTVDGSTASGWVGPDTGVDDYEFTGEVTDFALDGSATVYVDGQEVDPASFGESTLTIESDGGGVADYTFGVDGELAKGPEADGSDTVDGSTASGWVGPDAGVDDYQFTGGVTSFTLDGPATVYLDGQAVDPAVLGDSGGDDTTLPNSVVFDGMGSPDETTYAFAVSGEVAPAAQLGDIERSDVVEAAAVDGRVAGDKDGFHFSGDITDFTIDGTAVVSFQIGSTSGDTGSGAQRPIVFVTSEDIAAVEARIDAGDEPWAAAWEMVEAAADAALHADLVSVVGTGGGHVFQRDNDYQLALHTKNRVRDLALAFRCTGDDRYARKAIDQLYAWFLDPETFQEPVENGQFDTITQYITIPTFLYGADLLRGHEHWATYDGEMPWRSDTANTPERALERWAIDWQETFREPNCNNIYVWRAVARGAAGTYAGDATVWEQALSEYRSDCTWNDYNDDGSFQYEIWRENGYRYQLYRMKAHAMFCEIGRARGLDLYSENDLKRAFDFMAPYVFDPSDWTYGTGSLEFDRNHEAGVFELAYSRWQDSTYLDLLENVVGRPVDEGRLLGDSVTLLHGNRFEL